MSLEKNVTDHEPHLALFVNEEDDLIFYRKIAVFACDHLNAGGQVYLEIHEDRSAAVADIFEKLNFGCTVRKDFYGRNRMIRCHLLLPTHRS